MARHRLQAIGKLALAGLCLLGLASFSGAAPDQKTKIVNLHAKAQTPTSLQLGNLSVKGFSQAKKMLPKLFESLGGKTLYCGCDYKGKQVDPKSCGYVPKQAKTKKGKPNKRAERIEWEHVVPAHAFGQSFQAWRQHKTEAACSKKGKGSIGARACARKIDPLFARMEADLYNLFPAIGEINGLRSNYSMAEIPGEKREFGRCDVEISGRKIEPPEEVRGLIARIHFYMDWAYPGRGVMPRKGGRRSLMEAWHKRHPVSPWEKKWAEAVMNLQGNCNPFVLSCPKVPKATLSTGTATEAVSK